MVVLGETRISALIPQAHPLVHRISDAYGRLTIGQRRVVDILLERPHEAAFLSAAELGARARVSDSTVVRLPSALGYGGYPELRQELQDILSARMAPVDLLRERRRGDRSVSHALAMQIEDLQRLSSAFPDHALEQACASILRARRVFVIGLRGAFAVAHHLAYLLHQELGTVTLLSFLASTTPDELSDISRRDVLVAISAARYSRQTVEAAAFAANEKSTVIAITDSALSPLARTATLTIAVPFRGTSFFPSYVPALAVTELIAGRISRLRERQVAARLTRIGRATDQFAVLLGSDSLTPVIGHERGKQRRKRR